MDIYIGVLEKEEVINYERDDKSYEIIGAFSTREAAVAAMPFDETKYRKFDQIRPNAWQWDLTDRIDINVEGPDSYNEEIEDLQWLDRYEATYRVVKKQLDAKN